jgi:hypothetical protein
MGYQDRIFVLADSALWKSVKADVDMVFGAPVYMPIEEKSFRVERISLDQLKSLQSRMNIFLIGTKEGKSREDEYIRSILPENFKQGVDNGTYFYTFSDDMFAYEQLGIVMYAQNKAQFKKKFAELSKAIYAEFENKYFKRLEKYMFDKGEQFEQEAYLAKHFGWKVKVQHDYFIATQEVDKNYVWLRRVNPDRWLSVWKFKSDSSIFNENSLFDLRDKMASFNYGGDVIVREDSYLSYVKFGGRNTAKLVGVWKNDSLMVGGPFRTYFVHSKNEQAVYQIDYAVMAPNKKKKPYIDQLEVISRTFQIVKKDD